MVTPDLGWKVSQVQGKHQVRSGIRDQTASWCLGNLYRWNTIALHCTKTQVGLVTVNSREQNEFKVLNHFWPQIGWLGQRARRKLVNHPILPNFASLFA